MQRQLMRFAIAPLFGQANLLVMPGRKIVPVDGKLLDEGSDGVLSAADSQSKHDTQPEVFNQFAAALREVAGK